MGIRPVEGPSMITADSAVQMPVGELRRCDGQPAVGDHLAQYLRGDLPQLDEHGGVAVEVRNREEAR